MEEHHHHQQQPPEPDDEDDMIQDYLDHQLEWDPSSTSALHDEEYLEHALRGVFPVASEDPPSVTTTTTTTTNATTKATNSFAAATAVGVSDESDATTVPVPPQRSHGPNDDDEDEEDEDQTAVAVTSSNNNRGGLVSVTDIATMMGDDSNTTTNPRDSLGATNNTRHHHHRDNELYNFDRYHRKSTWRKEEVHGDWTMKTDKWTKQCASSSSSSSAANKENTNGTHHHPRRANDCATGMDFPTTASSPDSQLLHLILKHHGPFVLSGQCTNNNANQFDFLPSRYYDRDQQLSSLLRRRSHALPTRPLPGRRSYAVTAADGTCGFWSCQSEELLRGKQQATTTSTGNRRVVSDALGVSMSELLRRVEVCQRRREHTKEQGQKDDHRTLVVARDNKASAATSKARATTTKDDHLLWVDKHAPTTFSHLLSDERTNREVVRALRAWDPYVFHRAPPPRPASHNHNNTKQEESSSSSNNKTTGVVTFRKKIDDNPMSMHDSARQRQRPDESSRVILLSGNPGVGKTTLAHVVARHCGYRPLEVNGSDERSATVLTERIARTMESQTLHFSEGSNKKKGNNESTRRPTCLILDEIDGVDASGAMQALVEMIRADIPSKGSNKKTKKTSSRSYLRRPIILVCNNKFAPALRPLLPYCKQFSVSPPSPARLVSRLRAVLALESLEVSSGSSLLHQLVTATGGDIRSCLFTLQFACAKARQVETKKGVSGLGTSSVVDISAALQASLRGEGLKDSCSDIVGSTTSVFMKEKPRNIPGSFIVRKTMNESKSSSDKIMDLVQNSGETSRVLDSLFINVPRISTIDPTLDRYAGAMELLSSSDIYRSHTTHAAQNNPGELMAMQSKYLSSGAAAVHVLCRVDQKQDLVFSSRELMDCRFYKEANQALAQRFVESIPIQSRALGCADLVAVETSPYLLWILSAGNGTASLDCIASSMNLLSPRVQTAFEYHVSILRSLGLTYVQSDMDHQLYDTTTATAKGTMPHNNSQPKLVLDPPLNQFVQFQGSSIARRDIPEAMKGLLAHKAAHDNIKVHSLSVAAKERNDADRPKTRGVVNCQEEGEPFATSRNKVQRDDDTSTTNNGSSAAVTTPCSLSSSTAKRPADDDDDKGLVVGTNPTAPTPQLAKRTKTANMVAPQYHVTTATTTTKTATNFLLARAKKAQDVKSAQKRARAGVTRPPPKHQLSHSGSGIPMKHVMRLRYVKGFTQAVRVPCMAEDIL